MINDKIAQGLEDRGITDVVYFHVLCAYFYAGSMEMKMSVELKGIIWSMDEW